MPQALRDAVRAHAAPSWLPELAALVGPDHVSDAAPDLWVYARDRLPYATFAVRDGRVPGTLPCALVRPGTEDELAAVVRFARARRIPLIPYGAGSGVLGGAVPLARELVVDLKRLNRIVSIDETDLTVTVQAGMNGGQFEAALNARGYTTGHLPQSLYMSTVGGWAACRGAGQNSTRYGKIEDMVLGLRAILPDGRGLQVRPVARRAVGPSVKDLMIGAEGTLGVITELTLRLWRLPEVQLPLVLGFPSLQAGLDALRTVMQSELRPAVVRLYDAEESGQRTNAGGVFDARPFLAILEFSGPRRVAEAECALALEIAAAHGGARGDDAPYHHWLAHRFESYSPKWQSRGYYMDTIEVTAPWSAIPGLYARIRDALAALSPQPYFGTHWSHVYPEGACQYMTVRGAPAPDAQALALHARAWDTVQRLCLEAGASISHHHGVGAWRGNWLRTELGSGFELLQAIKDHLDPDNLFVPGKLGLRTRDGAARLEPEGDVQ